MQTGDLLGELRNGWCIAVLVADWSSAIGLCHGIHMATSEELKILH